MWSHCNLTEKQRAAADGATPLQRTIMAADRVPPQEAADERRGEVGGHREPRNRNARQRSCNVVFAMLRQETARKSTSWSSLLLSYCSTLLLECPVVVVT
jgi:hypothetical protein